MLASIRTTMMLGAVTTVLSTVQACYNYVPLETSAPPVGERVAFEITDRGRVGLSDRFGPGIAEIEGRVVQNQTNDYVIDVFRVSQINGQSAIWSGEEARLNRDFVGSVRGRQFSKVRTAALVGGIAVGVGILASRALSGSFSGSATPEPPPGPTSILIPFHR